MSDRVFVFRKKHKNEPYWRAELIAIPESKIQTIESQRGSENCYLVVNGIEMHQGSFDDLLKHFSERIDIL